MAVFFIIQGTDDLIHFFPFSKDARDSPFVHSLERQGVEFRIFPEEVIFRYKNRLWLLFVGWPKLVSFAFRSAYRSMFVAKPYPDTVVLGSHIEVIIFSLVRLIRRQGKPSIVLLGFIYTNRKSPFANKLRHLYFRTIFTFVKKVICHSTLEVERYSQLFSKANTKFVYIPYGLHIDKRKDYLTDNLDHKLKKNIYILTAGRSGRDYQSLFEAVSTLGVQLRVVCDSENALSHLSIPSNVNILRNCYEEDYIMQIKNAAMVVIPLEASDISAGQMVLIQALALAKPVIITRTPTVEQYVSDGIDAILVNKGDSKELRKAIADILEDDQLGNHLSKNALKAYEQKFSMNAFVTNIVNQVRDIN